MPFPKKTVNFDTENRVLFFAENWTLKIEAVPDLPSFAAVYTYISYSHLPSFTAVHPALSLSLARLPESGS